MPGLDDLLVKGGGKFVGKLQEKLEKATIAIDENTKAVKENTKATKDLLAELRKRK